MNCILAFLLIGGMFYKKDSSMEYAKNLYSTSEKSRTFASSKTNVLMLVWPDNDCTTN